MDFWNDNIMFITQRKWKTWIQKIRQSSVKNCFKKKKHDQMKNWLVKCIWNFPNMYIFKF
jgi:hypothetical protein